LRTFEGLTLGGSVAGSTCITPRLPHWAAASEADADKTLATWEVAMRSVAETFIVVGI
jgi:hypothetical protein